MYDSHKKTTYLRITSPRHVQDFMKNIITFYWEIENMIKKWKDAYHIHEQEGMMS